MTEPGTKNESGELLNLVKQLEELNERLVKIMLVMRENLNRILPDESIYEKKAPQIEPKQTPGQIGLIKQQITNLADTIDLAHYNLTRLERV